MVPPRSNGLRVVGSEVTWHYRWASYASSASVSVLIMSGWFVDDGQIIQVMLWLSILVVIGGFPFAQLYQIEMRLNVEDGGTHLLEITRYPLARFFLGRIDVAWDRKKVFTERTALDHMAPVDFKFGNSRVHDGRVVRDRLPKRDGPSGLQRLYKSRKPFHVFIDGQDLGEL